MSNAKVSLRCGKCDNCYDEKEGNYGALNNKNGWFCFKCLRGEKVETIEEEMKVENVENFESVESFDDDTQVFQEDKNIKEEEVNEMAKKGEEKKIPKSKKTEESAEPKEKKQTITEKRIENAKIVVALLKEKGLEGKELTSTLSRAYHLAFEK